MGNEPIEVRTWGRTLRIVVGGREVPVPRHLRDNVPYIALRVLANERGGRLVFGNVYELINALRMHAFMEDVVYFINGLLPNVPKDLRIAYMLAGARADVRFIEKYNDVKFTLIPRDLFRKIGEVGDVLYSDEFIIDGREFEELLKLGGYTDYYNEIVREVFVPTVIGFTVANKIYAKRDGDHYDVHVPYGVAFAEFVSTHMALGDLIILAQLAKALGADAPLRIVDFAKLAPQVPTDLVNPFVVEDAPRRTNMWITVLRQLLGDLRGAKMVVPIIEPSGVTWREAKVVGMRVTRDAIYVQYKHGAYRGKVTFLFATNNEQYAEAVREALDRNPWLVERIEENKRRMIDFLSRYEEFLRRFRAYAKLLL